MLLSINKEKIDRLLADTHTLYTVFGSDIQVDELKAVNYAIPDSHVYSVVTEMSPEVERYRNRVLSLRKQIIDKEHVASSTDELEHIINETRGR